MASGSTPVDIFGNPTPFTSNPNARTRRRSSLPPISEEPVIGGPPHGHGRQRGQSRPPRSTDLAYQELLKERLAVFFVTFMNIQS